MLSDKGYQEIERLMGSGLIADWSQADHKLKQTVQLLLQTRSDLLALYFLPQAWQQLKNLSLKEQATFILCFFKAAVIEINQRPAITHWEQAKFYRSTHLSTYSEMAEAWVYAHPEQSKGRFKPLAETNHPIKHFLLTQKKSAD